MKIEIEPVAVFDLKTASAYQDPDAAAGRSPGLCAGRRSDRGWHLGPPA